MPAFWEGVLAGYGIAVPVGAIAVLIVDMGLRRGFRPAFMAGAGAASADFLYASLAALAGGALPARIYAQFLGLTLLNPLTVAYFAALILGRGSGGAAGSAATPVERGAFVAGAGLASLSWQTLLAALGALAHRRLSPAWRTALSVAGNLVLLGLGTRLFVLALR